MAAKQQKRFKVEVTEEDISKAQRNDSYKCVVAQAIARTVPDATRIEVDTQAIRFTRAESGERYLYLTPPTVIGYVVAFDAGEEPAPFQFWIDAPMQIGRRVRTEAGRAADKARKTEQRRKAPAPVAPSQKPAPRGATQPVSITPPSVIQSEEEKQELVKQAYEAAKAKHSDKSLSKSDGGGRKENPRVYKTGKRVYGSRILRVNRYLRDTVEA